MKNLLKYIDRPFWVMYIFLLIVALLALFSASSTEVYKNNDIFTTVSKQAAFLFAGVVGVALAQYMPSKLLQYFGYVLLLFGLGCLYFIFFFPNNSHVIEINHAKRWIEIAGQRFQPSEIAKPGLVLVVADLLSRIKDDKDKTKYFLITFALTGITILPILQHNFSTAALIVGVVFLMWFLARIQWKYLFTLVGLSAVLLVSGYFYIEHTYIKPHKKVEYKFLERSITWCKRVDAFSEQKEMTDDEYAKSIRQGDHYQRALANTAVVAGGKSPFGVLPGNSKQRDFLPTPFADFIFAIMVEETGAIGALVIIFLYMVILFRACYVSSSYSSYGSMLMMMGVALMFTCQALISMAVAVGLGPVTGQPLPLVSAGGTSALFTSYYFACMFSVAREQNALAARTQMAREENEENVEQIVVETDTETETDK